MKFGTIPFVNMAPYYHFLSARWLEEHQVVSGNPRQLGGLAKTGRLDAAPFSYADGLELVAGGEFEWLESMGIAGFGPIRSILLVGVARPKDVIGQSIAVSPQTATTVRLLEVWLRQRHGITDYQLTGLDDPSSLRLLIGDDALRRKVEWGRDESQIDLSAEWSEWTGKPFVFARWAVRKRLPDRDKMRLAVSVRSALELGLGDLDDVTRAQSERTGLPQAELLAYLKGIRFKLGPAELAGAAEFEEKLALL
ncbi:MAG TPA: MqnA/MqnD/SBP family protein [bacterium]|jgi:chorismate dehydratase|nr:MqnA/MqnD/SBP family protein [bacterium]